MKSLEITLNLIAAKAAWIAANEQRFWPGELETALAELKTLIESIK